MICKKCGYNGMSEELISYQLECRNHLFCFEDVPAPKCPECGNVFISEESMTIMLAKVEQLSQKATISYHRCRWPKAQPDDSAQQAASQAAEDLVKTISKVANDAPAEPA